MALILVLGIALIGGAIIALPFGAILVPIVSGFAIGGRTASTGGLVVGLLCLVAYLPVLLVLSGIFRAYTSSAWTLTYMRLTRPVIKPVQPLPVTPVPPVTPPPPVG